MTPYLLNLCDLFLTLHAIQHGGVELNPLLKNTAVMVVWKVVGVGVLCWLLSKLATKDASTVTKIASKNASLIAKHGLRLCTAVYAAVCIYHFFFIFGGA